MDICREKGRSSARNKRRALSSSDSDEGKITDDANESTNQRRSSRIFVKKHKKEFRLPSRDEIWKDIPSVKSPLKLKRLTPRKTVNNFTKVYNDYNFDDYEDTSDETSAAETSESDTDTGREKEHRIKNFHKRIQRQSSSSEEDSEANITQSSKVQSSCESSKTSEVKEKQLDNDNDMKCEQSSEHFDNILVALPEGEDTVESDNSDVITPSKKCSRNRSILESEDDDNDIDKDEDGGDSDVREDESSESSEGSDSSYQQKTRSERLKMKQTDLFKALREAQATKKRFNNSHGTCT